MQSVAIRHSGAVALEESFVNGPDGDQPDWAHTSGWMAQPDEIWTLSCVMPCLRFDETFSRLLAHLSDRLTEAGRPWEILVVGRDDEAARSVMLGWSQLPGFRWCKSREPLGFADALWEGLERSRGEVVLIVESGAAHAIDQLPDMLKNWRQGARLVWTQDESGGTVVRSSGAAALRGEVELPSNSGGLVLLDRQLVSGMLQSRSAGAS
jgi:hypothetical protein